MAKHDVSNERQLEELLSAYYEKAPMEASYRLELWE